MKAYPEYKASGIDWLGEVPSYWSVSKLRYVATLNPSVTLMVDDSMNVSYLPMERLGFGVAHPSTIKMGDRTSGLNYFEEGDILLAKVTPCFENGKIAIAQNLTNYCGIGSSEIFVFRCNNINNKFFFYLLQNGHIKEELISTMQGTGGLKRISPDFVRNMYITIPPIEEQEQIAAYLDDVTGKIDELVKEKQAQLDDIRAYRTSLITETVTRGLNPNAPLKDSGIDWLGEIPEHWDLVKSSYLFDNIGSGTTPTSGEDYYYDNGTINWLQTGDLNDGIIEATNKRITQLAVDSKNMKFYNPGSLVIAMYGATIAKLGLLNINTTVNQACCVLTPSNNIISKYSFYYFYAAKKDLISLASGGGQPNISQATIANYKILIPPLSEQQEIADFLDAKTAKIDELIESLSKQIEELAEYKRAVITEAVTGKVDVRDWEPKA